ncbi:uncharacterized protein CcaverHIS019_0105450 [Cutaneotrichosporon cavernicola]|uniref:Granulins domain-containing protein n=1 Tax=Cutaneotrichosporon cavernicola TaxID=279322 RepID=A0AA48I7X2_9TREE|nr:uncharacterized protein CcaverHIS019_0105450 [Cutaneotrichosporon cavernicola]BEI87827.1 hypothetical protein CcaverHIS019_0105450 [Cutaneotrichosporon cavernicola]
MSIKLLLLALPVLAAAKPIANPDPRVIPWPSVVEPSNLPNPNGPKSPPVPTMSPVPPEPEPDHPWPEIDPPIKGHCERVECLDVVGRGPCLQACCPGGESYCSAGSCAGSGYCCPVGWWCDAPGGPRDCSKQDCGYGDVAM